jgi:hypothetical protein
MAHVHAYEAYGGAPEATTPDYVARNIIGVLCPIALCCRAAKADREVGVVTGVNERLLAVVGT